jgi:hypothetical protein
MRLDLATQLKTRAGEFDRDAKIKNGYTEIRNESGVVRKRPGSSFQRNIGTGDAYFLNCVKLSPDVGGLAGMVGTTIIGAGGLWDISAPSWDSGTTYYYGDFTFYGNKYWMYTGAGGSAVGVPPSDSSGWGQGYDGDTYDGSRAYAVGESAIRGGQTWYAMAPVTGSLPTSTNPYWSLTAPGVARYYGTASGVNGAICGSQTAAGASAMAALGHNTCATQWPSGSWATFAYATSTQIFAQQWSSTSDCVTTVDMGIGAIGTITTV